MVDVNISPVKYTSEDGNGLPQVAIDGKYVGGGLKTITVDSNTHGSDPSAVGYADAVSSTVANELPTQGLDTGTFVFDTTSNAIFRCIQTSPSLQFTREFAGVTPSDLDLVGYAKISDLPTDPDTGGIDIASDAELAEALLNGIQVESDGTTNLTATTAAVPGNTSDALIVGTAIAVPAVNQKAAMTITLNTNAIGGDAGAA